MFRFPSMKKPISSFAVLAFFISLLAIGVSIYKDFGVPTDDPAQAQIAVWNHRYIFKGDPTLLTFKDRYYGATFELPLLWIQSRFANPNKLFTRHFILYLAFLVSLVILYFLSRRLFRNPWWGLLTVILLAASPRIYTDAFYNSKDIPFMEMFILAVGTLVLFFDTLKKKRSGLVTWALLGVHALTSGLLIGTRIAGIAIIPISIILLVAVEWGSHKTWKHGLAAILIYLTLTAGFTVLFWPILWHDPLGEFINAFQQMSKYNVYGKAVLYLGQYVGSDALPWHYLPVWIGISTPLVVLAGLLPGTLDWIRSAVEVIRAGVRSKLTGFAEAVSDPETLGWLAVIGWLVIPVAAIYWFHSVLYNGWRQMYFIYPPLLLLSTRGFLALYRWFVRLTGRPFLVKLVTLLVLAVGLAEAVGFMIRYHPNEYLYFNQLAGDPATLRQRFELDYWGLSYKQAIDYILAHDPSNAIRLFVADPPGLDYIYTALVPQSKSRLVIVENQDDNINYFVGDFLFHPSDYFTNKPEYYSITVHGTKIIVVYHIH